MEDEQISQKIGDVQKTEETNNTKEQDAGDILAKFMTTIFKEVSHMAPSVEPTVESTVESAVEPTVEPPDDSVDSGESVESKEDKPDENCQLDICDMLKSVFGTTGETVDETMKDVGKSIRNVFEQMKVTANAKKFFLEQLNTCTIEEATQKTIEQFDLGENAKFDVNVTITL